MPETKEYNDFKRELARTVNGTKAHRNWLRSEMMTHCSVWDDDGILVRIKDLLHDFDAVSLQRKDLEEALRELSQSNPLIQKTPDKFMCMECYECDVFESKIPHKANCSIGNARALLQELDKLKTT